LIAGPPRLSLCCMKKNINYPAQITVKSIFTHDAMHHQIIETILMEHGAAGRITYRESKKSKFISYTITAEFASESHLNEICAKISALQGFIMLF
jgi:putative lipoic acid-binding regulatory protein